MTNKCRENVTGNIKFAFNEILKFNYIIFINLINFIIMLHLINYIIMLYYTFLHNRKSNNIINQTFI